MPEHRNNSAFERPRSAPGRLDSAAGTDIPTTAKPATSGPRGIRTSVSGDGGMLPQPPVGPSGGGGSRPSHGENRGSSPLGSAMSFAQSFTFQNLSGLFV